MNIGHCDKTVVCEKCGKTFSARGIGGHMFGIHGIVKVVMVTQTQQPKIKKRRRGGALNTSTPVSDTNSNTSTPVSNSSLNTSTRVSDTNLNTSTPVLNNTPVSRRPSDRVKKYEVVVEKINEPAFKEVLNNIPDTQKLIAEYKEWHKQRLKAMWDEGIQIKKDIGAARTEEEKLDLMEKFRQRGIDAAEYGFKLTFELNRCGIYFKTVADLP